MPPKRKIQVRFLSAGPWFSETGFRFQYQKGRLKAIFGFQTAFLRDGVFHGRDGTLSESVRWGYRQSRSLASISSNVSRRRTILASLPVTNTSAARGRVL